MIDDAEIADNVERFCACMRIKTETTSVISSTSCDHKDAHWHLRTRRCHTCGTILKTITLEKELRIFGWPWRVGEGGFKEKNNELQEGYVRQGPIP